MNQGNDPAFVRDDGVWQDGGLLVHFPAVSRWVAIFLAFQSQAWHTDDVTGHAIEGPPPASTPPPTPGEATAVRIVAAMVNPVGPAPEHESVLLMNASPERGRSDRLADRRPPQAHLPGPGPEPGPRASVLRVPVTEPAQLSNQGGLITLLDAAGLKVGGRRLHGRPGPAGGLDAHVLTAVRVASGHHRSGSSPSGQGPGFVSGTPA